jgi:protein-S-isoprenylcysteine O-methyltransferase Ste14
VPDIVFRIVLPLYGAAGLMMLLFRRAQLAKRLGHDPFVIRPLRQSGTLAAYLELVFVTGEVLLALDIVINAFWADAVRARLAVPLLRESAVVGWVAFGVLTAGLVLCAVSIRQMGTSWRIGIDPEHPGPLVMTGVYRYVRHPIYTGMMLMVCGLAGVTADALSIAVAVGTLTGLPVQSYLEEEFLSARHGDAYADYRRRTRRF